MATSNDTWPFLVRYYSASSVYGTNEHQCLRGLEELLEVAATGESMPPKSTYFFPKVPTGLVFNPLA